MRSVRCLCLLLVFPAAVAAQNLVTNLRIESGEQNLQVLSFWPSGTAPAVVAASAQFNIVPLEAAAGTFTGSVVRISNGIVHCETDDCKFKFPAGLDPARQYILFVDFREKRYWSIVNLLDKAEVRPSKDPERRRSEIVIAAKAPLAVPAPGTLTVSQTEYKVSPNSYFLSESQKSLEIKSITNNDPNTPDNVTELTLGLKKKLDEGVVTTVSASGVTAATGKSLAAIGSIDIAGLGAPPEVPKFQIALAHLAAVKQKPVFDLTGTVAFRTPKLATLSGRYLEFDLTACQNLIGELRDKCREKIRPINYFAGFNPSVSFDIGFNSTKSKNAIILNLPFVYYWNLTNRSILDTKIENEARAYNATPLRVYGGWANTPLGRLADIKLSFGPKIEFFHRYQPRNILAAIRADFEFHRWVGNIAGRRKLVSYDLNAGGSRDEDRKIFGKLRVIDFGWKLVPYVAFDGGAHVAEEIVNKRLGGIDQTVTVPTYPIARVSSGAVGTVEWLVHRRYVGFSVDYAFVYVTTTETNSYTTTTQLLLRRIRGFQPFLKTTFEFAFDPAKRYAFRATYENGRALPSLDYLNKVTTGFSITY